MSPPRSGDDKNRDGSTTWICRMDIRWRSGRDRRRFGGHSMARCWWLILFATGAFADATCLPHSCNRDDGGDSVSDSRSTADSTSESSADNRVSIEHPDKVKIRNTPSIGLGTPAGSAGVGIAFPGGGLSVNVPLDRAFTRLQGFVEMGMAEAGITDYCSSSRRAKRFGGTVECTEVLSLGLAVENTEEHERLEERIKELETKLEAERRRQTRTTRSVDQQEQRRRDALKQLEAIRG